MEEGHGLTVEEVPRDAPLPGRLRIGARRSTLIRQAADRIANQAAAPTLVVAAFQSSI